MNKPQYIIVHHTASVYSGRSQYDAVNRFHKNKGWGMIGYHYFIEGNGEVKKGRMDNVSGAHCSQRMMNYRSLGVCLAGHFDQQDPTIEQCKALNDLIQELQRKYNISNGKVDVHREYATYKSCWGSRLPTDVLGYLEGRLEEENSVSNWAKKSFKKAKKYGYSDIRPQEEIMTGRGRQALNKHPRYQDHLKHGDHPVTYEEWIHMCDKAGDFDK